MEGTKSAHEGSGNDDQVSKSGEDDEFDWEEGGTGVSAPSGENERDSGKREWNGEISLSVNGEEEEEGSPAGKNGALKKKVPAQRRATAQDKEFAEMVHKVHLLCLLARGRIVDAACNDPLLQASMLSLVPPSVSPQADSATPTRYVLGGVVSWFMGSFRIASPGEGASASSSSSSSNQPLSQEEFSARLRHCTEKRAGSPEEVAALGVVVLRTLGFMTRYVTVLDVASLKPDAESLEASENLGSNSHDQQPFLSSHGDPETTRVASLAQILAHSVPRTIPQTVNGTHKNVLLGGEKGSPSPRAGAGGGGVGVQEFKPDPKLKGKTRIGSGKGQARNGSAKGVSEPPELAPESESGGQKRSGDDEFERELAMAIAATAAVAEAEGKRVPKTEPTTAGLPMKQQLPQEAPAPDTKRLKRIKGLGNSGNASLRQKLGLAFKQEVGGSNGAVWSRKLGPVRHWAEVYCTGDSSPGRWVHVDPARGIVDGADKMEGAAAASRRPLRYVVAFSGGGAKDVTRRYVTLWSTVDRLRVDPGWWNSTLTHLKQLEATAANPEAANGSNTSNQPDKPSSHEDDRAALEDMEMETKTFTEPLPTNQQAYKSHHLYVLEKWLTKYQTLHPKGPVLGYCAGHPVYPRACVQVLHTPDSWLREGFKVKPGEASAKLVKASRFAAKKDVDSGGVEGEEMEEKEGGREEKMTPLFGKWQTHPWQPPRAVNGKVPRNERGQVDVWSEKCIPPGTVHLRFPGLVPVAQKLGVDFAPAMVGFEVRKGRTFPVYDGLVICEEFKDLIMDAYMAHEQARFSELLKKRHENAAKRWRQLIYSMATRQRLQATYEVTKATAGVAVSSKPTAAAVIAAASAASAASPKLKQREALASPKAFPKGELFRSAAADSANAGESLESLAKTRAGVQKQQGRDAQPQHVHQFPEENQSYDEDTGIRTKLCSCGFSYFVEEM